MWHILRINFGRDEDWGPFVGDNRGKKSVVLDVKTDVGMQALQKLIASADVFVSNFRLDALRRLEIDPDTLMNRYPTLICAQITGYGMTGPEKDTPAYDMGAFWARTGLSMNSVMSRVRNEYYQVIVFLNFRLTTCENGCVRI